MAGGQRDGGRGRGRSRTGGRGGRGRSGRSGGERAAALPSSSGKALHVELAATPEFYAAMQDKECPAEWVEGGQGGATPLGTSVLALRSWRDLEALISWFREGLAADPQAELTFAPQLTKQQRASVQSTTTAVTRAALGTVSRGVGAARRVVVLSQECAQRVARRHDQSDAEGLLLRAGAPEPEKERWEQRVALPGDDAGADSVASVCGTDRDPLAELGSNLSDWGDQQAMPGALPSLPPADEEEEQQRDSAPEEASAATAALASAEAVVLAAKVEAEAGAAADEAAVELEEDEDQVAVEVEEAEEAAQEQAVVAFAKALAAAEAAEAAAKAAEAMPGEEAAQRAAAFRREGEAAVRAAAAAAVVAGSSLDEVFTPRHAAVTKAEGAQAQAVAAGAGSSAVAAAALPGAAAVEAQPQQQLGSDVPAGDIAAVPHSPVLAELQTAVASVAEQASSAARSAAAAGSKAVVQARAELEARLPEWRAWAQEHPGAVAVGAGAALTAIAALLVMRLR